MYVRIQKQEKIFILYKVSQNILPRPLETQISPRDVVGGSVEESWTLRYPL